MTLSSLGRHSRAFGFSRPMSILNSGGDLSVLSLAGTQCDVPRHVPQDGPSSHPHWGRFVSTEMGYLGGSRPVEFAQSSMWEAVSACRAFLSRSSFSLPGGSSKACLRTPSAHLVRRSRSGRFCLDGRCCRGM